MQKVVGSSPIIRFFYKRPTGRFSFGPRRSAPCGGCRKSDRVVPQATESTRHVKGSVMYVVIRNYSGQGASELFDLLGQREDDVKELIGGVPGFIKYAAFRSGGGGTTVTICEDKDGTDESSKRAAAWVAENVTGTVDAPAITEGSTVLEF